MATASATPRMQSPYSTRIVRSIKNSHDEAFLYINQGLSCDELHQTEQAVHLYCKGLRCIDLAVEQYRAAQRDSVCDGGEEWVRVQKMIQKMSTQRSQIQSRVDTLMQTDNDVARSIADPPPSYEDSLTPDIIDGGDEDTSVQLARAERCFVIADGVQIFFISAEGYVSAPSYPSELGVYRFKEPVEQGVAPSFLKVGKWTYPLLSGRSPVLHANYGAYLFPDVNSTQEGASVGLIIPNNVSSEEKARFEQLLHSLTDYREQLTEQPEVTEVTEVSTPAADVAPVQPRTSEKIAGGIVTAAGWLARGLSKGADKAEVWLHKGSSSLQKKLKPEEQPKHIGPKTQKGMEIAAAATGTAVKVTTFVVATLGQGTAALCRQAAPHLRRGSEKYLPASFTKKGPEGTSKLEDCIEVAHGGLKGFGTVHLALERAAVNLGHCLKTEAKTVVAHKYGEDAGQLAGNAVGTGVNTVLAVGMVSNMGARTVARSAVKQYARQEVQSGGEVAPQEPEAKVNEKEQEYLKSQEKTRSLYPPGTNPSQR
ncbi:hypothetical protein CAPTEDRAFT_222813 [Capitella teleta]|uniref:MIT domain-containing protein n=1 Tax=Capitella teleta TaxID=283909 RepID=R7TKJ0_CAPTE|nr:hypothetical protein CAPTEDRAFT_222813 [Capitella teleta]|eukprot:ELT94017.1 hypothetical protein CAPTEDRAFT_222813 [Capitella teleta]